jgi:hypothetical protein
MIYSKLRRNIVESGGVYKIKDLLGDVIKENQTTLLDDPEFYDISTKTLKLGNLCAKDIKSGTTPKINMHGQMYTTYCALSQLSSILEPSLVPKLHYNIDKIYSFLRRDLKYDNKVKFHSLMKTILEYDDPANTMNIIVDFIEDTDSVDEIANALDRFRKSGEVSESDIEEFLRKVKSAGHQEYERSFYGEHFKKYSTRVVLKYRTEEENKSILERVEDVIDGKYDVKRAVGILYQNITGNYSSEEMIKSDLECIKDVYNEKGDVVIEAGNYLEVKKIDYAADSYLSEFMAMYKSSKLPDYAHEPKFVNTYNQIIDGLFELFQKRKDILEDIQRSFAGIIYDDRIFIKNDDIELYWSNKGRSNCLKDHRLSIRYRIKNPVLLGYVYEGGDVLKPKPIKINVPTQKIFCPIIKPRELKESYNLEQISSLLVEGRKEDILKKYGKNKKTKEVINYFSDNDPSGNNKYLEWMVKVYLGIGKQEAGHTYENISYIVELFHKNLQRIKNKDINSYTFERLAEIVLEAEEKRKAKELEKRAKKEKTVIYEDDNWLVVSPHSWKASCYYGAGTKWCVTSKDTSRHWENYSRNASFFYVINKNLKKKNPLYKVAYRVIGRKGRYELWDAEDLEMSRQTRGKEWLKSLPPEIIERAESYHEEKFPISEERPEWVDADYRAQAIVNHLDNYDIEKLDDYHYGMEIYEVDDEYWVAAEEYEMDDALYDYYDGYDDGDLLEYYDNEGYYLHMYDEASFIDDEVDHAVSDISDNEFLESTGLDGNWEEIGDKIKELNDRLEDLDSEEDEEEYDELEMEISDLETEQEDLIEEAKETYKDNIRDDWERCFSDGAVECLVHEKGWYSSAKDLYESGSVELDKGELVRVLSQDGDYDSITGGYGWDTSEDDEGDEFYVFQVDY